MKIYILFLFLLFEASYVFTQNSQHIKIDSISRLLNISKEDTNRVNILLELSKLQIDNNPEQAINYAKKGTELAHKLNFQKGEAKGLKSIGIAYLLQGDYSNAIDYWNKSMVVYKKLNDLIGISNILNNIGVVYFNKGDYIRALDYYVQSLTIAEKKGDKLRIVTALINIGGVYSNNNATLLKSLEYYKRALPIALESKDKDAIITCESNLGEIYLQINEIDSAIFYLNEGLKFSGDNDNVNLPFTLNNLGKCYWIKKDFVLSHHYHLKALNLAEKLESKLDIVQSLIGLANLKEKTGENNQAISNFKRAESIGLEIGSKYELKSIWEGLSRIYSNKSDYVNAYKYQAKYSNIKDTLYNIETDKKLAGIQFDFDLKKKQNEIDLLTTDGKLKELELTRSKNEKFLLIGGIAFFFLISFVIFRQRNKSEKLLLNILPKKVAKRLKRKERQIVDKIDDASIIFIDLAGFTAYSKNITASEVLETLNSIFSKIDRLVIKFGLEKIKTIGDGYMVASGLPEPNPEHAVYAAEFALEVQKEIILFNSDRGLSLNPRIGIECGPVVAGVIGDMKFIYDLWGDTVNTASRMESHGESGKIQVTQRFRDKLVEARPEWNVKFFERGIVDIKGKGTMKTYFISSVG